MRDDKPLSRPLRPTRSDWVVSAVVALLSVFGAIGMGWPVILVSVAQVALLPWRRVRPLPVFWVIAVATLAQAPLADTLLLSNLALMLSLYAVIAWDGRRSAIATALGVCLIGSIVAGTLWWGPAGQPRSARDFFVAFLICQITVIAFAAAGEATRRRRQLLIQLHARAVDAERERDQHARLAAQSERTRIAREMHDVVAHALAVIVVQSDGAAYAVRHSGSTDAAVSALDTIGSTSRDALAETRRLVGVLRQDGDEPELSPAVTRSDVTAVVDRVRAAGLHAHSSGLEVLDDAPREVVAAVHRVVQEALTNVIKHAGHDPHARIELRREDADLVLRVVDDGRGNPSAADGMGHGLVGMRERVHVLGGTVSTGPRPEGGYAVTARIPLGAAAPDHDEAVDHEGHDEHGRGSDDHEASR